MVFMLFREILLHCHISCNWCVYMCTVLIEVLQLEAKLDWTSTEEELQRSVEEYLSLYQGTSASYFGNYCIKKEVLV